MEKTIIFFFYARENLDILSNDFKDLNKCKDTLFVDLKTDCFGDINNLQIGFIESN